ncbi:MAG: phosphoribosylformylglycinamidine synthase subunit PurS [Nitrospirae bacterium]|nr:phosphoribosylformylglycinamidine synthase subunit PurS [Nitrospirota bacterium]
MKVKIYTKLKESVLDPQGQAVTGGLKNLGFNTIKSVRIGKVIDIVLDDMSALEAQSQIKKMCEQLLANTVIEDYNFTFEIEGKSYSF